NSNGMNAPGSAIKNEGTMAVHRSTISANGIGAGTITSGAARTLDSATLTLDQCVIADNQSGGGFNAQGNRNPTLDQCVIADNRGVGISSVGGMLTTTDCTVSGNSSFIGGGLFAGGRATITDSNFLNNSSELGGGAIALELGEMTVSGSTIAGNT